MKISDMFDIHVNKVRKPSEGNTLPIITVTDIPAYGFMSKPMKEWHSSEPPALAPTEEGGVILYPFDIIFDPVSFKVGLVGWRGIHAYIVRTNLWVLRYKLNVCENANLIAGVFFQDSPQNYSDVERSHPDIQKIIEIFMYLRSSIGRCKIAMEATGKAIKRISASKLVALDIPLADELQTEKAVNGFYEEIEIHKRLYQIHNIFGTVDSIQPPPNTVCSFCKSHLATEYVARRDTWLLKSWAEPACSQCAPLNKQTWLT